MTFATTTMSILDQGQTPLPTEEAARMQTNASGADAEARRLAAAVARGDEAAFQQLYDVYQQRLFRFTLMLARGDELLAQEVVQSVFLTAAKKLRHAENEAHLWNWLARIARQHVTKNWRQERRNPAATNLEELPECADGVKSDAMLEKHLDAALLEMSAEERQLIEGFYFDRLSHKEIAGQLNLTPKAVSSRLERAREKLRQLIIRNLSHET